MTRSETPQAFRRWAEVFEADIRAGKMSLLEVVDIAVSEMVQFNQLCPECAVDSVREGAVGYRHGHCVACHFRHLKAGHETRMREIIARRDNDSAKQRVSRLKRALEELPDNLDDDELDDELDRILDECEEE